MELMVSGRQTFAATYGRTLDPGRPTVLFVHGAGMDHSVWTLQARHVAFHLGNALSLDLPGHGRSVGPPLTSIEALADWLSALLDGLEGEPVCLVGHSMGALICLQAAAKLGDRIAGLSLLGAAPAMPVHPALLDAAAADQLLARELIADWGHGPIGRIGGNAAPGGWLTGHAVALLTRAPQGVLHQDLMACNSFEGALSAAARVACPTLVIAGSEDRMTPAKAGAALAEALPGAELTILPGAGHMMMVEQPDETLDALIAWLGRVRR
jgi:pimeloyl-ACP methyl ester carboxylesterase